MIPHPPSRALDCLRLTLCCAAVIASGLSSGCSGRSIQADNPVLAAAPPRMSTGAALTAQADGGVTDGAGDNIEQASFSDSPRPVVSEDLSGVAATVNGIPILVADVLERFTPQLKAAEQQLSADDFAKLKRQLIQRELPMHIEQAILVDSALSRLKAEQRTMVEEQLDKIFATELANIQAEMGAKSLAELEAILQQSGTSITNLQRSFNNRQLAGQAMGLLTPGEAVYTRAELLEEYEGRREEFTEPEQVKWQQIWISYNKYGGKQPALDVLDAVVSALKSGQSFDDVARQYSDGLKAQDGGHWDWTQRGSLANEEVERMLFELPVGAIGQVVTGETAFQIVRVTDRKPQTTKPFSELQDGLARDIKQRKQQEALEKVVAKLKDDAIITTMFDGDEPATP